MFPDPIPPLAGHQTERLAFRRLTRDDVEAWLPFFDSPEALRHLRYQLGDRDKCVEVIDRQLRRYDDNGGGLHAVVLRETGELLGLCGLLTQDVDGRTELEVGYHFLPKHWGNGYATEAAIACRDFAFQNSEIASIISLIVPENEPSQRVAQRNGMVVDSRSDWNGIPVEVWRISRPTDQT